MAQHTDFTNGLKSTAVRWVHIYSSLEVFMYLLEASNIHSPSTTSRLGKALVWINSVTYYVADSVASLTGRHTPKLLLSRGRSKAQRQNTAYTNEVPASLPLPSKQDKKRPFIWYLPLYRVPNNSAEVNQAPKQTRNFFLRDNLDLILDTA